MTAPTRWTLEKEERTTDTGDEALHDEGVQHAVDRPMRAVCSSTQRGTNNHDATRREHARLASVAIDDEPEPELAADDPEICDSGENLAVWERPGGQTSRLGANFGQAPVRLTVVCVMMLRVRLPEEKVDCSRLCVHRKDCQSGVSPNASEDLCTHSRVDKAFRNQGRSTAEDHGEL